MNPASLHPSPEDLFGYRDGELPSERRTLVEAHVVGCQACRTRIDRVSELEAALRRRPDGVGEEYFERLGGAVTERMATTAGAAAPGRGEVERPIPPRRSAASGGAEPTPRRDRVRRAAALSALGAAAVVVVAGLLVMRGGGWGPIPGSDPGRDSAATGPARAEAPTEAASPERSATEGGAHEGAPANPADASKPALLEPKAPGIPGARERADSDRPEGMAESPAATQGDETLRPGAAPSPPPALAEQPSGYGTLVRRRGLPPVWDPRVSSTSLLDAESELRILYQTGRAGADSARVRLYLAEAARLRYEAHPDSGLFDGIIHHYLRAIRLSRTEPDVARIARERLDSFGR